MSCQNKRVATQRQCASGSEGWPRLPKKKKLEVKGESEEDNVNAKLIRYIKRFKIFLIWNDTHGNV